MRQIKISASYSETVGYSDLRWLGRVYNEMRALTISDIVEELCVVTALDMRSMHARVNRKFSRTNRDASARGVAISVGFSDGAPGNSDNVSSENPCCGVTAQSSF